MTDSAATTLLDGSLADVVDTTGQWGRCLVAATTALHDNPFGIVLFAEGSVQDDIHEVSEVTCENLMGEPESPGFWVWEGTLRLERVTDNPTSGPQYEPTYEGTWREASSTELALFRAGRHPFQAVADA